MEQAKLDVEMRQGRGKGSARAVRRSGLIPGIVYGHNQEPITIQFQEHGLRRIFHLGGENILINMNISGGLTETVMIKEIQRDPVSRRVIHADFMRVSLEERVTTHIPVVLVGNAPGVKEGGVLEFLLRELRIECQAGQIPEHIEVDISSLGIGDQIRVGDIKVPEGMVIHDDSATIVVTVASPTVIKETEEGAVPEDLEKEPEVIRERRKEEEEEEE
ncbi:TPA: 50S ribosomal protein L25/general stress protein Ctc [Candidatus Poribacteria bacterium]|nr:50S ribosomal protein L25/general stress protein Ctc [Candidatus Poribacteria bacterium]